MPEGAGGLDLVTGRSQRQSLEGHDKNALRADLMAWTTAFPDLSVSSVSRVVGDDAVAAEIVFTGTNTVPMPWAAGDPADGQERRGPRQLHRSRQGRQDRRVPGSPDAAGVMMQLGLVPSID